jgi:predicted transcriptional regulator
MVLKDHELPRIFVLRIAMRRQFVLDKKSSRQLDELAETHAGNRSLVVREAIGLYAAIEASLEEIESNPEFIKMMERTALDIKEGRVFSQKEVQRLVAEKRKRR